MYLVNPLGLSVWLLLACLGAALVATAESPQAATGPEAALSQLEAHLAENPDDPDARFQRALLLLETGDQARSLSELQALAKDYPDYPEPYNNLAVIYAMRGELEQARQALLDAVRLDPAYVDAQYNLGNLYLKLAGDAFAEALKADPHNPMLQAKLRGVAQIAPAPAAEASPPAAPATSAGDGSPRSQAALPPNAQHTHAAQALVSAWAEAWSRQDVDAYLGYYSQGFIARAGAGWKSKRRAALHRPKQIQVAVSDVRVAALAGERLAVRFVQAYRSDSYRDRVRKQLILEREQGTWKIAAERVLETLAQ